MTTNDGHIYRATVRADNGAGESVLAFHVARFPHSNEAQWRASIARGSVLVNGRPALADARLAAGDELEFHREPWQEPEAPTHFAVAFEDEHVLVVVKPSGLQVLPAGPFKARTLLKLVRASDVSRAQAAPAHRLGRGTSGLMAFGKTALGRAALARQLRDFTLGKTYLAWVEGARLPGSLAVRVPIGTVAHGPLRIHAAVADGKPALTRVRVLRRMTSGDAQRIGKAGGDAQRVGELGGDAQRIGAGAGDQRETVVTFERALVAAQPITGRPDQIRIHLAAAGAPIVGDPLFGSGGTPKSRVPPGVGGYLLHAAALSFTHPATGERVRLRSLPEWL